MQYIHQSMNVPALQALSNAHHFLIDLEVVWWDVACGHGSVVMRVPITVLCQDEGTNLRAADRRHVWTSRQTRHRKG